MITRKQIFVGLGVALTTLGIYLAIQFNRLKNFSLKVRNIKVNKLTQQEVNLEISFNFVNRSDLQIALAYQVYDIYLNNKLVSTVKSDKTQTITPKSSTPLKVNVSFKPIEVVSKIDFTKVLGTLLNFKRQNIKVVTKLGVKYLGLTIPVTTTTEDTIENWSKPK